MSRASKCKKIEIVNFVGRPSWCRLDDGTEIELTPVVSEVRRVGKDQNGKPLYGHHTTLIGQVTVTATQRKKGLRPSADAAV